MELIGRTILGMNDLMKPLRWWAGLVCALVIGAGGARAGSLDDDFLAAREAFRAGDAVKLERYAKSLNGYPLEPYVAYWRFRLRLNEATPAEVAAMLARLQDGTVANSLRSERKRCCIQCPSALSPKRLDQDSSLNRAR